jgi:hypothetical protein
MSYMGLRTRIAVVVVLAALASGCYESEFPLDTDPLIDLNPALLGAWRCLPLDGAADEPPVTLTIARSARPRIYDLLWQEPGDAPDRYDAYASVLQGTTLMNVRERTDQGPAGKWIFMRATLMRPNALHLQVVADKAMAGVTKTAAAVRATVERERNTGAFYTDVALCVRTAAAK